MDVSIRIVNFKRYLGARTCGESVNSHLSVVLKIGGQTSFVASRNRVHNHFPLNTRFHVEMNENEWEKSFPHTGEAIQDFWEY